MKKTERILLFFVLPILAALLYPPEMLAGGIPVLVVVVALFSLMGAMLWLGRSLMLTFAIFIQGMNVIVRIMMFFPHAVSTAGKVDIVYIVASLIGLSLSSWLVMRLDRQDVRMQMIH